LTDIEKQSCRRFGWLCSYTPVEILVAAGLTPVRLDAGETLLLGPNPNVYQLICPYVRAVFNMAQEKALGPIEGVLFMKCCDGMLRLYDLWKAHLPGAPAYVLPLPKVQSSRAVEYFARSMRQFAKDLEKDLDVKVTDDSLMRAIRDLNDLRSSVLELYRLRSENPQAMSYTDLRLCISKWLSMPPADAAQDVQRRISTLPRNPSSSRAAEPRVLISSSTLDQIGLLKLIEDAGMEIVADDHCSGLRHFDENVSESGDLYYNLSERYLKRWPCARMQAERSHIQRFIEEVETSGAAGVVYVGLKYCDQSGYEMPRMQAEMKKRHIPFLYIENDYTKAGMNQLKVRIEAFAEMLSTEF
jgi:benzoyl-CoA reductase/2-hydroxyglutaryl-CoA dehydratase subunit BcrC/BadD/HgdB